MDHTGGIQRDHGRGFRGMSDLESAGDIIDKAKVGTGGNYDDL